MSKLTSTCINEDIKMYGNSGMCFDQRVETFFEDDFDLGDAREDSTKQLVEDLLHHVYRTGDAGKLESCLQELASLWNLDNELKDIKIVKREIDAE